MPRVGSQYVLFLRKTEDGDFLILTGYELLDGSITPIDGEGNKNPRMDLPFTKYRGADQAKFLKISMTRYALLRGFTDETQNSDLTRLDRSLTGADKLFANNSQ
jgi:hypothetical protein